MMKVRNLFFAAILFLVFACGGSQTTESAETETETTESEIEQETPSTPKVNGSEVTYAVDTLEMKGYIAYDENMTEKRPGILVIHEWWGHNDYARQRADMLAELGYVALAVDMYGDGKKAEHPKDAGKFAKSVMENVESAKARFTEALETLKANPNVDSEKIAAIGYCFGGSVALSMANAGMDLDAVAAFHSGLQLPIQPEAGEVKAKVLVCNGAADPFVTQEQIEAFKKSMEEAKVDFEFINYPDAVHAFTDKGADAKGEKFDLPLKYNAEADQKSWEEMKELFASVF